MFGLGMTELIVILLILLLLFGASRLPGIAAGLGGAIKTFKKSVASDEDDEPVKQIEAKSSETVESADTTEKKTA
jgi:sec-independent protein translocase protein TatA